MRGTTQTNMKKTNTRKQGMRNAALGGLAVVMGAVSLAGGAGCSEFNPIFRPHPISSTVKDRGLFDFGRKIDKMYEGGEKWTLDDASNTLYVRGEHFSEAMKEFGIKEGDTFQDFYPQSKINVQVRKPVSAANGEITYTTIAEETGVVAGDGSFDTEFGSFDAETTRSNLDNQMTKAAREMYKNSDIQVVINEETHPFSQGPNPFLGLGMVNSTDGAPSVLSLAVTPNMQYAVLAAPTKDSKYITLIKQDSNENKVSRDDPRFVNRVIAYGDTGAFVTGVYNDLDFNDGDLIIGLNNRPLRNFDAFVGRVSDTVNGIVNLTGAYQTGRFNVDFMTNENAYLPSKLAESARGSNLDRLTNRVNSVSNFYDAAQGLGGRLGGSAPTGE